MKVDNQGALDAEVFALHTPDAAIYDTHAIPALTTRAHLGRAAASTKSEFAIPSEFIHNKAAPIHFIIDQVKGKKAVVDQQLFVTPIDTVSFTIPPI